MRKLLFIITCFCLSTVTGMKANTVVVRTYEELRVYLDNAVRGDTILIANGTYRLDDILAVRAGDITIGSQSGDRDAVILTGDGMNGAQQQHGFWVDANNVTIRDITISDVRNHCIQTNVDVDGLHVINCILKDAGEQILKVPRGEVLSPSENGIVENCLFEYSAGIGPRYYIGGVDCHFAKGWIVRNNVFKYIKSPEQEIAEHAIHFWNDSENTLVEKNVIINCDRGIGFGLGSSRHSGGIICNNMIYHDESFGDVGISLESSPDTQVYNNSIFYENDYYSAIEYRFPETKDVYIANNLTNKVIWQRDGATGTIDNNITDAMSSWFSGVSNGDLHLVSDDLSQVIDKGIDIPGLSDDIDGDARPLGLGTDIGADEYSPHTGFERNDINRPEKFVLYQNYPNPFNPKTVIRYAIARPSDVKLEIFTINGRKVKTVVDTFKPAGIFAVEFETDNLASGAYLYRLRTAEYVDVKKMIMIH